MKNTLLFMILVLSFVSMTAQDVSGNTIEIEITNIESDEGKMMIGLYDSEKNWLKTTTKETIGEIKDGKSSMTFENVPDGTYGISSYHDENDNDEFDVNFLGIPKEDVSSSNNAPARMGPPTWEDANFEIKGKSIKQTIKL